jgi:hypothetical protein
LLYYLKGNVNGEERINCIVCLFIGAAFVFFLFGFAVDVKVETSNPTIGMSYENLKNWLVRKWIKSRKAG